MIENPLDTLYFFKTYQENGSISDDNCTYVCDFHSAGFLYDELYELALTALNTYIAIPLKP